MKIRIRLSLKLIFFILVTAAVIYIAAIGYISFNFKNMALTDAKKITDSYALEYANLSKTELENDINIARTIAQSMSTYFNYDKNIRRKYYNEILKKTLIENPKYVSVWDSWELYTIEPGYNKTHGRVSTAYYRMNDEINITVDSLDIDSANESSLYYGIKTSGEETITDPYFYSYTKNKDDQILEASIVVPIKTNGKFEAIVGMDVTLDRFQSIVQEIKPYKNSYAFLLSNDGIFVAHPNSKYLGKSISIIDSVSNKKYNIIENIKAGKPFSYEMVDTINTYFSFAPFTIGKTKTPWVLGIAVPLNKIKAEAKENFNISIKVGIIGLVILTIIIWIIAVNISWPLRRTTKVLKKLALGQIDHSNKLKVNSQDELGEMASSVNTLIDGLYSTSEFAEQIGKGNLNANFDLLGENDVLGKAIQEMRESLLKANEEEKNRKINDKNINWASEGLTKFARILRENNDNINKLSYNIISNLVDYMDANQGGLYIKNDKDKNNIFFELVAHSGFLKEKYKNPQVIIGEGLVGQCIQEELTIYMNDTPDDYITIASGLGGSKPQSILIVPLKLNDEIYGVLEIESFLIIPKFQIEFVEKLGEIIAATISNVKINIRTAELLGQSKLQADELASQEEEMRQNMEEMQATQEEASKRETEMHGILEAIDHVSLIAEYDMKGKIIKINDGFIKLFELPKDQMLTKKQGAFELKDEKSKEEYKQFWNDLKSGIKRQKEQHIKANNKDIWLFEEYIPILDMDKKPYKVLNIAVNITEQKIKEQRLKQLKERKKALSAKAKRISTKSSAKNIQKQIKKTTELFEEHLQDFQFTDVSYLIKVYKGDLSKIKNIVKLYLKSIPEQLIELSELSDKKTWNYLRSKTTALKSKMAYIGLRLLNDNAKKIEAYCENKINLDEIPDIIDEMAESWKTAESELKTILLLKH
ncbi:MAG: GAF domain-containing protein [Chlorobi bacterium]|nr:GAF domain-containing protein [Chlorobiota bacterium]